ncbi:hypothetical protein [Paludibacterium purpuratum]|uniref:Uncharacterized protein n=1 Tax=Paludibacterium purpuratum TaxID=1144873 RepID=A0A4R7B5L7_9NEIS|nr:hypothetical protein [Paludibacterium purpuratum]TDR79693.1 hypothetical protein DFP86_10757 [Paludibacterium purpuratum]
MTQQMTRDESLFWDNVDALHIKLEDSGQNQTESRIYRNGMHQVGVIITAEVSADGTPLTESNTPGLTEQLYRHLYLINDSGHADLPRQELPPGTDACTGDVWCYTANRNAFATGGLARANPGDPRISCVFYVMCPERESRQAISLLAKIDMPDGSIDTSGGENTDNAAYESIRISSLPKKRYTDNNTTLTSYVAAHHPLNNPPRITALARNYLFGCDDEGFEFVKFALKTGFGGGEYFRIFDADAAYNNGGIVYYRNFRIAYTWDAGAEANQRVFGLRPGPNDPPDWWPLDDINQDRQKQYFTVVEFQTELPGFGYPGTPVNDMQTPNQPSVYFTAWDQYGNGADFHPATTTLLDEPFKVLPGRS